MTLDTSIAGDWSLIDGIVDVTFTPQNPAATGITGVKALQRQLSRTDLLSGLVGLEPRDTVWHVWEERETGDPLSTALGREPTNGDAIVTAGDGTWRILGATYSPRTSRWRCICRKDIA